MQIVRIILGEKKENFNAKRILMPAKLLAKKLQILKSFTFDPRDGIKETRWHFENVINLEKRKKKPFQLTKGRHAQVTELRGVTSDTSRAPLNPNETQVFSGPGL